MRYVGAFQKLPLPEWGDTDEHVQGTNLVEPQARNQEPLHPQEAGRMFYGAT